MNKLVIGVVVFLVAVLVGLILWYFLAGPGSGTAGASARTTTILSQGLQTAVASRQGARISSAREVITVATQCSAVTAEELTTALAAEECSFGQNVSQGDAATLAAMMKKCDLSRDVHFDERGDDDVYYSYAGDCWNTQDIFFVQRGVTDIVVPLTNVSGKFHAMYLGLSPTDLFAQGFDPGPETTGQAAGFATMIEEFPTKSTSLVGVAPGTSLSETTELFDFNAVNPVAFSINDVTGATLPSVTREASTTVPSALGVLRIAPMYADYDYGLNGDTHSFRVYINHPTIPMGVKAIWDGTDSAGQRIYKFADITDPANPVLVTEYTDACVSFWNQPHGGGEGPSDAELAQAAEWQAPFSSVVMGMPIEVVNDSVDFSQIQTKQCQLDLLLNSTVSFREAKEQGFTEATLAANKAMMCLL